jgi:hypothetical protein
MKTGPLLFFMIVILHCFWLWRFCSDERNAASFYQQRRAGLVRHAEQSDLGH